MEIFEQWLKDFNREMIRQKRFVLLLLDNASGHNVSEKLKSELSNVALYFFKPNVTSHIQPDDQGIIRTWKCKYRQHLVRHCVKMVDEKDDLVMPDLKQAIYFSKQAWLEVTKETVANCWRKASMVFVKHIMLFLFFSYFLIGLKDIIGAEKVDNISEVQLELEEKREHENLEKEIKKIDFHKHAQVPLTASQFIDIDKDEESSSELSEQNIYDLVMGKENKEENELDRGEPEPPKSVSSLEVKKALEIVLNYVEQNESFNETDFFFINGLKSRIEEIAQNNKQQVKIAEFLKNKPLLTLNL